MSKLKVRSLPSSLRGLLRFRTLLTLLNLRGGGVLLLGIMLFLTHRAGLEPLTADFQRSSDLPTGERCTVKPGSVYDGDTARFFCEGEEVKVRFCGIDAPEVEQPLGIEARDYLRSRLPDNAQVIVVPIETDHYGRLVAEVWREDGRGDEFVNGDMVLQGWAWHYEQYSSNCPGKEAIERAEELARSQSLGVFTPGNVEPWEWRR